MSDLNYAHIAPLIVSATQQGHSMQVVFRCPAQGVEVSANASIQRSNTMGSKIAKGAKSSLGWGIKSALARSIRKAMGHGIAGSVASGAVYSASTGSSDSEKYSETEKQQAIVDAFEDVRSEFAWDNDNQRFISASAAGATQPELTTQLNAAPVVAVYDRGVLARMLAEVAAADGNLSADERSFFTYFITPDMGTLDEIVQKPPLSAAELGECTVGPVRETMLMLTWALALSDGDVDAGEAERLSSLGAGLAIETERCAQLKGYAQAYQIDSSLGAVYASGQRDETAYQGVVALGQRLGMNTEAIERVDIRYRKRFGLV